MRRLHIGIVGRDETAAGEPGDQGTDRHDYNAERHECPAPACTTPAGMTQLGCSNLGAHDEARRLFGPAVVKLRATRFARAPPIATGPCGAPPSFIGSALPGISVFRLPCTRSSRSRS